MSNSMLTMVPTFYVAEIGVVECIGYDGDAECVGLGVADRKADAIYADRPFFNCHITFADHLFGHIVAEFEIAASFNLFDSDAFGGAVNMALHDMSVKAPRSSPCSAQG